MSKINPYSKNFDLATYNKFWGIDSPVKPKKAKKEVKDNG